MANTQMKFVPKPEAVKHGEWVRLTHPVQEQQRYRSEDDEKSVDQSTTPAIPPDVSDHICGSGHCERVALNAPPALPHHLKMALARKSGKASSPIRAWLSYYSGQSSAANTALATSFAIAPNQDSSWASWQAVFDEFRVIGAEFIFNTYFTTVPSVYPANSPNTVAVYDPTSSVTLSSVNAALQFERFALLRTMLPSGSYPLVSPSTHTKDGCVHFKVKIPTGPILSTTTTTNSTGLWRATADAANYDWGSFACYVSVGGTSAVLRLEGFIRMEVEFRTRR